MKSSIILYKTVHDKKEFDNAVSNINGLLLNDSFIMHDELFREEGPYSDPKISNHIFSNLGNSIIDYSSHQRTPECFKKGDIWLTAISENPRKVSNFISSESGYYLERRELNWAETALNYARMKERLKLIYGPEEIKSMLADLMQENSEIKRLNEIYPVFFDVLKDELSKNLYEIWEGI